MDIRSWSTILAFAFALLCMGCNWRIRGAEGVTRHDETNQVCENRLDCIAALDKCRGEYDWVSWKELYVREKPRCAKRLYAVLPEQKPPRDSSCIKGSHRWNCSCKSDEKLLLSDNLETGYCVQMEQVGMWVVTSRINKDIEYWEYWPDWQTDLPEMKGILDQQKNVLGLAWQAHMPHEYDQLTTEYNKLQSAVVRHDRQISSVQQAIRMLQREYYQFSIPAPELFILPR